MKLTLKIFLIVLLCFSIGLKAQNTPDKIKEYNIWITMMDQTKVKGILYFADIKGINLYLNKKRNDSTMRFIEAQNIDIIKIRRTGKVGTGIWVGALSGFAVGGLVGLASGDDPDKTVDYGFLGTHTHQGTSSGDKAMVGGLFATLPGAAIGALVASKKVEIIINGNLETYKNKLNTIKKYAIKYR